MKSVFYYLLTMFWSPHYVDLFLNASHEYAVANQWLDGWSIFQVKPLQKSYAVFDHHDLTDGIACYRIPSVVSHNHTLIAFAEARIQSCDDCGFSRIAYKVSTNGGVSWSHTHFMTAQGLRAKNPTVLYDTHKKKIVLHYALGYTTYSQCSPAQYNMQAISSDGVHWTHTNISEALYPFVGALPGPGNAYYDPHTQRYIFPYHYKTASRINGQSFVLYKENHSEIYHQSNEHFQHMDEATIAHWNSTHMAMNMRNDHTQEMCNCRAVSFSNDSGNHWSSPEYTPHFVSPICQGTMTSHLLYTFFVNPHMQYARSNLTLKFKHFDAKEWRSWQITNPLHFSDYTSMTVFNDSLHEINIGVLWGSCSYAVPFRTWCLFDRAWSIRFTRVPFTYLIKRSE